MLILVCVCVCDCVAEQAGLIAQLFVGALCRGGQSGGLDVLEAAQQSALAASSRVAGVCSPQVSKNLKSRRVSEGVCK
jgi:hypothetical protein